MIDAHEERGAMAADDTHSVRLGYSTYQRKPICRPSSTAYALLGARRAICAVSAPMLTAAYQMQKNGTPDADFGADHFDNRAESRQVHRFVNTSKTSASQSNVSPLR